MHVLSSGGFSLQTTKNGKGQLTIELMGHVSLQAQDVVPMEFYSAAGSSNSAVTGGGATGGGATGGGATGGGNNGG